MHLVKRVHLFQLFKITMKEYFDIDIKQSYNGNPVLVGTFIEDNEDQSNSNQPVTVYGSDTVACCLKKRYNEIKSTVPVSWFTNRFDTAVKLIKENYSDPYRQSAIEDFLSVILSIPNWVSEPIMDQVKEEFFSNGNPPFNENSKYLNLTAKVSDTMLGGLLVPKSISWCIENEKYYAQLYSAKKYFNSYDSFFKEYLEFNALNPLQRFVKLAQYFPDSIWREGIGAAVMNYEKF